jgi:hypothetical protein
MLVAAQLYQQELQQKLRATWYDLKYQDCLMVSFITLFSMKSLERII